MNTNKERKTKSARAYAMLCEAAWKIETLSCAHLERIARAVNPELKDFELKLAIYDYSWWADQDASEGTLERLSTDYLSPLYVMNPRLAFFRAEKESRSSGKLRHRVVLVLEFSWRNVTHWINAETGLFWEPECRIANRRHLDTERKRELEAIEAESRKLAAAERAKILHEQTEQLIWVDQGIDFAREARTETLELMRRKAPKDQWETVKVFATKYLPAGSDLPNKSEQDAFRIKYLREQGSTFREQGSTYTGTEAAYPEHAPNHSEMHEVRA